MAPPNWLAPLTGGVSLATCFGLVGVYAYGRAQPADHASTVTAEVPAGPDEVMALLTAFDRRPEWRPHVERIARIADGEGGRPVWRELDPSGDRFDFVVAEVGADTLSLHTAHPEDIGMVATWTWTVTPGEGRGSRITLTERGTVDNEFFRGYWALADGQYRAIEEDLAALSAALGGTSALARQNR